MWQRNTDVAPSARARIDGVTRVAVRGNPGLEATTPLGLAPIMALPQGSRVRQPLGWRLQPLRGWKRHGDLTPDRPGQHWVGNDTAISPRIGLANPGLAVETLLQARSR